MKEESVAVLPSGKGVVEWRGRMLSGPSKWEARVVDKDGEEQWQIDPILFVSDSSSCSVLQKFSSLTDTMRDQNSRDPPAIEITNTKVS